jgi:hypothetical protein
LKKKVRTISATAAVLIFFLMSIVSWATGLNPATASSRALAGAVITYVIFSVAGNLILNMVINEIVKSKYKKV